MDITRRESFTRYLRDLSLLKKLFWLYFLLLIFEGALRKWVVPQYSAPLLIIRDPVGVMIIWEAYRTHKWPRRWSAAIQVLTVSLFALALVQVIFGGNPWLAALFGLRSYVLPFPVAFIMGENLDQEDLRRFAAATLFLLLPLTALALAQYASPASSPLNVGAYKGGKQIAFVNQGVRASGTFSFVIGLTYFGTLAAPFIFYAMAKAGVVKNWLLWGSTVALILMVPTTGARALVVQLAAVFGCVVLSALLGQSQFVKIVRVTVPIALVVFLASFLPIFSSAMQGMSERFAGGNSAEGGTFESSMYERTVQPVIREIEEAGASDNWLGAGMGRGAVAVQELLEGSNKAVAGEYEFSREIVEMGPIAGSLFGIFKIFLAIALLSGAFVRAREEEPLALLLIPLALITLLMGVPEQPTEQGFMVLGIGLCIAAAKAPVQAVPVLHVAWRRPQPVRLRVPRS